MPPNQVLMESLAILQGTIPLDEPGNAAALRIYSPPHRSAQHMRADVVKGALGYLMVGLPSLSQTVAKEAALAILTWASAEREAVPGDPGHPANREVVAYALHAFDWFPVWASLPRASQTAAANLFLEHIRRGPEDPGRIPKLFYDSPFFSALLSATVHYVFRGYPNEVKKEISDIFFRYATQREESAGTRLILHVSRGHVFRHLTNTQRLRVALWLLVEARKLNSGLRDVLTELSSRHVFSVLAADERRVAARLLMQYAGREMGVTSSRSEVRLRTDPVSHSLTGLAKSHVFHELSKTDQERVALLMVRYAAEQLPLDPIWPERDDTRECGVKRGLEGLRREWVFNALPGRKRQEAVRLLLHYAERGPVHRSADDLSLTVYDDTKQGLAGRARRALARPFVQAICTPGDRARLEPLGIRPSPS